MNRRGAQTGKLKATPDGYETAGPRIERAHIAITDKNQIVREGLAEIVRRDGRFVYIVAVATGADFLQAANEHPIHIGVVGWSFADLTGGDVLRELKRRQSKIRVIIYSGEASDRILREAIRLGACGFESKRADPAHLLDVIATVAPGRLSLPQIDLREFANNPLNSSPDVSVISCGHWQTAGAISRSPSVTESRATRSSTT
ncbi:MAG TPA: response regulator transcription factor [Rhizomicrobium sp.]|jgi:two-component system nitrate/nitrite response regulator NarP|nr:response regulator transcription factor [Rhizomicrobium sp.]